MTKRRTKLRGRVDRVIKPHHRQEPEKAQIEIQGADDLYKEIRIENVVTDEAGKKAQLKQGQHVDVVVETEDSENHIAKEKGS